VHATTLFSNAVIERKGAPTGLITTKGFRDTLEIGRERKYELYDIKIVKPAPLVPRHLRLEVPERIAHDGSVRLALDEEAVVEAAEKLIAEGVTSAAIGFLHSYANPSHERRAADIIAARFPQLTLSASIDVAPEIREYERISTTVINGYIKPLAERYLSSLAAQIAARDISAPLLLMLSNGGLTHLEEAKRTPVQLLESGPAAGALVAAHLGARDGLDRVLAFDMGGTTAKLSVVDDGRPSVAYSFEVARERRFIEGSGLPVRISTLELIEIGAGGGSIAHLDDIGLLKVGPVSAGSEPGPAAYGRGGAHPTVTDADFLLGYLDPAYFVGGTMAIDMAAAEAALGRLADRANLAQTDLAWGIHDLVNENMANAARVHIAEHGKDPRGYTLLATGGAGPVHAYYVAKKLGLSKLIAPRGAGAASALGLLIAPARVDRVATTAREMSQIIWPDLEATFARLEAEAGTVLTATLPGRSDARSSAWPTFAMSARPRSSSYPSLPGRTRPRRGARCYRLSRQATSPPSRARPQPVRSRSSMCASRPAWTWVAMHRRYRRSRLASLRPSKARAPPIFPSSAPSGRRQSTTVTRLSPAKLSTGRPSWKSGSRRLSLARAAASKCYPAATSSSP
jgi:N-methylhydantoinase A